MGRRSNKIWAIKICSFFASVAFMAIAKGENGVNAQNTDGDTSADTEPHTNNCGGSANEGSSRFLMLVSTLDGKISALNVAKEGSVEWSFSTGSGPMLSSSISKLELTRDGKKIHLIPSLDGGLYQYDGQSVEPVPFNADTLLSSSFRLSDNSIVVGGKETETYGVDVKTGKVKYMCDMKGCKLYNIDSHTIQGSDETLVISRNTKTVRAVELTSGNEIWNFSVGQHEVAHIIAEKSKVTSEAGITDESRDGVTVGVDTDQDDEDSTIHSCTDDMEQEGFFSFPWWGDGGDLEDTILKVIVPKGLVLAMSKSNPGKLLWQHKFSTAIANAWILEDGKLREVDLFDASNVPALSMETEQGAPESINGPGSYELPDAPALYIGVHEKQFYVQSSVQMMNMVEDHINSAIYRGQIYPVDMPRVTWKPYMATASSRTPAEIRNPLQITWEDAPDQWCDNTPETMDNGMCDVMATEGEEGDTGVKVWSQYPYDLGYYLFPDFTPMQLNPVSGKYSIIDNGSNSNDFYFEDYVTDTLWRWWKEVLAISIFTSVILNVLIVKLFFPKPQNSCLSERSSTTSSLNASGTETTEGLVTQSSNAETTGRTESESEKSVDEDKPEYHSRYYSDFEQISCLGRGGFGVVYHTRNRLDDCDYAVKRITLNNSEKAREKVMREVKALAKLDNVGIVRYYQAWLEIPPPGWQEERDKEDLADVTFSPTPGYIITEFTPSPNQQNPGGESPQENAAGQKSNRGRQRSRIKNNHSMCPNSFNPLKPFGEPRLSESEEPHLLLSDNTSTGGAYFGGGGAGDDDSMTESQGQINLQRGGSTEPFLPSLCHDFDDMSGSFSLGINGNMSYVSDNSFDVTFERDPTSRDHNGQRTSSTPFRGYQREDCSERDRRDRKRGAEHSVDIVFEDSGCSEKSIDDTNGVDHGHAVIDVSSGNPLSPGITEHHNHHNTDVHPSIAEIQGSPNEDTVAGKKSSAPRPSSLNLEEVQKEAKERDDRLAARPVTPPLQKLYLYIQMQLCRKESLKEWLASNTLSRDRHQCLDIFDQIVGAVDYVHSSGLMHRDLKPSNIFFSLDGTIKVGDFGLVTALEECGDLEAVDVVRTPASVYYKKHTDQVGTKLYMSPEQIGGRKYTHKVDIYALGLIFFELFYPFATQMERIRTLLEVKRLIMPKRFLRELPDECTFVKQLLSPTPDTRPSTKDILAHSLLKDFQDARLMVSRIRSNSRSRTVSQSSKDSNPHSTGLSETP